MDVVRTPHEVNYEHEREFNSRWNSRYGAITNMKRKAPARTRGRKRRFRKQGGRPKKLKFTKRKKVNRRNRGNPHVTSTIVRRKWKKWMRRDMRDLRQLKQGMWIYSNRGTNVAGYQNTVQVLALCYNSPGTVPTTDPGQAATAAIEKIWYTYNNTLGTADRPRYLYIESVSLRHEITSGSQFQQTVVIRDIIARRDHSASPVAAWDNGLLEGNKSINLVSGQSNFTNQTLRVTPYQSNIFCQLWKIIGEKTINLAPGATHKHNVTMNVKKRINVDDFKTANNYKKGMSIGGLITHWGQPANQDGAPNTISNLGGALDIITTMEIKFKIDYNENTDQNLYYNNLSALSALTVPVVINQATYDRDTTLVNA